MRHTYSRHKINFLVIDLTLLLLSWLLVCFYVFDQDKHGYFESPELKLLMNILHKVPEGETVKVSYDSVVLH